MPLQLTMCRLCIRSRPEFLRAVQQLAATYPSEIVVVELDCMAACDDVPAVMIDTDYYPNVEPGKLIAMISSRLPVTKG